MPRSNNVNPLFNHHHLLLFRRYVYFVAFLAFLYWNWTYTFDAITGILRMVLSLKFGSELSQEEKDWYFPVVCFSVARFIMIMVTAYIVVRMIDRLEPTICETHAQITRKQRRNRERLVSISEKSELLLRIEAMVRERVKDRLLLAQYHDVMIEVLGKLEELDTMKSPRRKSAPLPDIANDLFDPIPELEPKPKKKKRFVPNLLRRRKPPEF